MPDVQPHPDAPKLPRKLQAVSERGEATEEATEKTKAPEGCFGAQRDKVPVGVDGVFGGEKSLVGVGFLGEKRVWFVGFFGGKESGWDGFSEKKSLVGLVFSGERSLVGVLF